MVVSKLINFQRKAKPRLKIKILYLVEMFPDKKDQLITPCMNNAQEGDARKRNNF